MKPGRRPDPELPQRVYRAALEVYVETGWAGFTIDAVAARGKVGKSAIYQLMGDKQTLLIDSLRHAAPESEPSLHPTGDSFFAILVAYVDGLVAALESPLGLVLIRAQVEAKIFPELLGPAIDSVHRGWQKHAQEVVESAIKNGELPAQVSPTLIFDLLRGTVLNRFLLTPYDTPVRTAQSRRHYAERVVHLVLAGVTSTATART